MRQTRQCTTIKAANIEETPYLQKNRQSSTGPVPRKDEEGWMLPSTSRDGRELLGIQRGASHQNPVHLRIGGIAGDIGRGDASAVENSHFLRSPGAEEQLQLMAHHAVRLDRILHSRGAARSNGPYRLVSDGDASRRFGRYVLES